MVLELTMVVIDNSEYMRNGDFPETRYKAQLQAVEYLFNAKTGLNPENTVGLLALGGNGPVVLSTLTTEYARLLEGLHKTKIGGSAHVVTGIQVAALALKNRQNKVLRQRIIVFVGLPVEESEKDLERLAKKMRKNEVAIDIINFGEAAANTAKLERFAAGVNKQDTSHLVTVAPGGRLLVEEVVALPIVNDGSQGEFGGGADDLFGDPNMDPELALALRMSLEEEQARQLRAERERQG